MTANTKVVCPKCARQLRVPPARLNKKLECPGCKHRFVIKKIKAGKNAVPRGTAVAWRMRTEEGDEYGPVPQSEFDAWLAEGRVDATCQLLQDGWDQWRWADEVFPQLAAPAAEPKPAATVAAPAAEAAANVAAPAADAADAATPAATESAVEAPSPAVDPLPSQTSVRSLAHEDSASPGIRRALEGSAPWMLFLAIIGFLAFALSTVAAVAGLVLQVSAGRDAALPAGAGAVIGVVLAALFYLLPAFLLLRSQHAIGTFLRHDTLQNLHRALLCQRRFWSTVGVLMTLVVVAGLVAIVVLFTLALTRQM